MSKTATTNKTTEPSNTVTESDTENEFFDACDSLDSKLHSLSDQSCNRPNLKSKKDYDDDDDDDDGDDDKEDQVLVDEDSDSDFDSEKIEMFKKFDDRFNLKSDSKTDSENKVNIRL